MNTNLKSGRGSLFSRVQQFVTDAVRLLFPIEKAELKKFIPMAAMMFIILFNYNVVRTLKDGFMYGDAGAEVINFLKPAVVLPASFLFVIFYSKVSNMFSKTNVFYVSVIPFVLFNIVFTYFLYPNTSWLHPNQDKIRALIEAYPRLKPIFPVYGLWTYSMFYTFSELWGTVGMNLLFWQFANRIVSVPQSKRFYTSFGLIGNVGFLLASWMVLKTSRLAAKNTSAFATQFSNMMNVVILLGLLLIVIYWALNKYVLSKEVTEVITKKAKKSKPSLVESFKTVFSSKYLGYIMLLIFCYNSMINLVEVTWKGQVKAYTEVVDSVTGIVNKEISRANYNAFAAKTNMVMAVISIILFPTASFLSRKFKWVISASITPTIMVPTSILFFAFLLFPKLSYPLVGFLPIAASPMLLAVLMGALQNIGSKSTKYALFDPTKEMTYVPLLDEELKSKGKAAVDVAGSRISKSFGGAVQLFLLFLTGSSQLGIAPYLMLIITFIGILWFVAINRLSKEYTAAVDKKKQYDDEASTMKKNGASADEIEELKAKYF
ncbi:MAG: NTP/NDP exchange transporter [Alphaproteobacteria bacterium]|nr:MAG: NTP/NDP exchange transporter [Alphaproteobacteria bacterium]